MSESFVDIILDELKTKENKTELNEGVIPITPFIAYAAFKRRVFNALLRNKLFVAIKKASKLPIETRAKAEIGVEKARAGLGISSGGTTYKLTKEQMNVMSRIFNKYGKNLVDDILEFRRNVLAPYQLIKRKVKKGGMVSSKDVTGLTRDEFKAALESGRKKLQARSPEFFDKSEKTQDRMADINTQIKDLDKIKSDLQEDPPVINYNVINRLYRKYDVGGDEIEGYSREALRKVYDEIMSNYKYIEKAAREGGDYDETKGAIERSRKAWSGKTVDLTKDKKGEFYKGGNFNVALGKYFFSMEILKKLKNPKYAGTFKATYMSIIDEMRSRLISTKKKHLQELISMKKNISLTDKEKKVWGKRLTGKEFSGDLEDYYQKLKDSDFFDRPVVIERSQELKDAERKIENEVRKFERKLRAIITPDDYARLKRYRLIGNLIAVKELRDPKNLFKSKKELGMTSEKSSETGETSEKEEEPKEKLLSKAEFYRKLREIASIEYDTMAELNNAKEEAEEMADKMKKQGNEEAVEEYADILRQIKMRRTTEAKKLVGHELEPSFLIDIDDIEKMAKDILGKSYTSVETLKQDNERMKSMIERYKKAAPDAEKQLSDIEFLFGRVDRKISKETSELE